MVILDTAGRLHIDETLMGELQGIKDEMCIRDRSNPTYAKVQMGAKLAREQHVDMILGVGGGSVIDCCKMVAAQAKTDRDLWEMEFTHHELPSDAIPMGAIVTASGTGAEMNGGAVITNEEKRIKTGMLGFAPRFAVLDPAYTLYVPRVQVISGAFDTLSHALETYLGSSDRDNVSDDVSLAIMRNTVVNMRRLLLDINCLLYTSLAAYYIFLAVMRYLLVRYAHKSGFGENTISELKRYRLCGAILIMMNLALAGVVILVLYQNRGFHYAGSLIYVMALYTFYTTIMAIINVVPVSYTHLDVYKRQS